MNPRMDVHIFTTHYVITTLSFPGYQIGKPIVKTINYYKKTSYNIYNKV